MGVHRLRARLEGHGERITFTKGRAMSGSGRLVIDGPSFAFWIYQQAIADVKPNATTIGRRIRPTYSAFVKTARAWLDRFEQSGIPISWILFDGALPDHKRGIRMERVQESIRAMSSIRLKLPQVDLDIEPVSSSVGSLQYITASDTNLTNPPFLVIALLDYLLSDETYRNRTLVLPAEADAACVSHRFASKDDIILTGDTDLILYSRPSRVMFFGDVQISWTHSADLELSGVIFKPDELMSKLGVERPLVFGYVLQRNRKMTLERAAVTAKKLNTTTGNCKISFSKFNEQYTIPNLSWPVENAGLALRLQQSDPRTCEVIFEALFAGSKSRTVRYFPPNLFEDTKRESALRPSQAIRVLALSVLSTLLEDPREFAEIDRENGNAIVIRLNILERNAVNEGLEGLIEGLRTVKEEAALEVAGLRLFALLHVLKWTATNGKKLPTLELVFRLAKGQVRFPSWPEIHLSAQVEGTVHALRFLRQILDVQSAMKPHDSFTVTTRICALVKFISVESLMPFPCAALRVDLPEEVLRKHLTPLYL